MILNSAVYNGVTYNGPNVILNGPIAGFGSLSGVSAVTSTTPFSGIGIALGSGILTGVTAATSVLVIEGIDIMVNGINQIRAPNGTLRTWRNIYGDVITFNQ